jgi:hypothetical protein
VCSLSAFINVYDEKEKKEQQKTIRTERHSQMKTILQDEIQFISNRPSEFSNLTIWNNINLKLNAEVRKKHSFLLL